MPSTPTADPAPRRASPTRRTALLTVAGALAATSAASSQPVTAVPPSTGPAKAEPGGSAGAPTQALAAFAIQTRLEAVPAPVRALFRTFVLDNFSTMLAGIVQPVHGDVVRAMREASGGGPVEALGGARVNLSTAVLLDGLAAADFEFEHVTDNAHPASAAFPALLGLAAAKGRSGAELMAAMIVSYELATRIGAASTTAVETERGFHNPGLNGVLAAAAGSARLLNLSPADCASAMGLAGSSAGGLLAFADTGAMTKRLHPARAAQLGLESALMAQQGVEGPRNVLEDSAGFLHAFSPRPEPAKLLAKLGEDWTGSRMIIKLSPVHAFAQFFVRALNAARDAGRVWDPAAIERVNVGASAIVTAPGHMVRQPRSLVDAQYSVPFSLALAIAKDLRNPLAMNDQALADPIVQRIAAKITFSPAPAGSPPLGGDLLIEGGVTPLHLKADRYPGFPGAEGYAEAVEQKLDQVLHALGIADHSPALRHAAQTLESAPDARALRDTLLRAGRAAKARSRG